MNLIVRNCTCCRSQSPSLLCTYTYSTVNLGNMLAIVIRVHLMCYTCVPSHIALLHIYYTPNCLVYA